MSVMNKPDYKIFAQDAKSGEYVAFPDILRGWGITLDQYNGFPPMELFNSAAKRIDEWLMYLTQRGLPEWDAAVDYPKDAMIQHTGVYYVSLKVTKGEQPNNSQASWKKLTEFLGVDGKLAKDQNGADIQDKQKFIENLGLGELHSHFIVTDKESRMLSPNKEILVLANDNKTSGVWDDKLQRILWAFDGTGKLTNGTVPVSLVSGAGTAATRNVGVGDGQVPDMSYFPISGKGSDSVVTSLPNGLILQCFSRLVNNSQSIGQSTDNDITFPAAFPTRVLGVFISKASYPQIAVSAENQSLTGFNAKAAPLIGVGTQASVINIYVLGY